MFFINKNMGCCSSKGLIVEEIKKNNKNPDNNLSKNNELAIKITSSEGNLTKDKLFLKEHNITKEDEKEDKEKNKINDINIIDENCNDKKEIDDFNKEFKLEDKNNKIDEIKDEKISYLEENVIKLENQNEKEEIQVTNKNIMIEKDIHEEIENLKKNGLNKINNDEYPKCIESLNLADLEKFFIEQSEKLNEIEKSFLIYNWLALNISLDLIENKNEENLEDIIKKGNCSNVNFAKLYKYLGEKLNLKIQCIEGYSKLLDEIENIPNNFIINHLYNMITIEEKNYLIDSCFGSGYIINSKYIKEYNNFYFCIEPSKMILFNYPKDDNYQLLENKIDYETFYNTSKFYTNYFNFHIKNNFKQSNYICKGIKNFQIKYPNNNSIKFKFNLLKEDEKTNKFEEYGFKYKYRTSYSNRDPLIGKIYSFSQIEYGKNKFQVFAKKMMIR